MVLYFLNVKQSLLFQEEAEPETQGPLCLHDLVCLCYGVSVHIVWRNPAEGKLSHVFPIQPSPCSSLLQWNK